MNLTAPIYIIDTNSMQVTAQIDEIDIPAIRLGQKADIKLDSAPNTEYEGSVKSISMAPITNPQNSGVIVYEVKVVFNTPPPPDVKLGMSTTVDIITDERKGVLIVPDRAIHEDDQGNPVVNIMKNEKIETRQVKVGISDGIYTEITEGINAGDIVIITRSNTSFGMFGQ
jgi:HlyD family secretion protein